MKIKQGMRKAQVDFSFTVKVYWPKWHRAPICYTLKGWQRAAKTYYAFVALEAEHSACMSLYMITANEINNSLLTDLLGSEDHVPILSQMFRNRFGHKPLDTDLLKSGSTWGCYWSISCLCWCLYKFTTQGLWAWSSPGKVVMQPYKIMVIKKMHKKGSCFFRYIKYIICFIGSPRQFLYTQGWTTMIRMFQLT